jgi:hypothetical protein
MLRNAIIFFAATALSFSAHAAKSPFKNLDQIAESLSLQTYAQSKSQKTVKIAILDNGFRGYKAELGKTLLKSTVFHAGPVPVDSKSEEVHGLFMAQIVSGLLAKTPGISYELHLFSAFGYSNLDKAVSTIVAEKFDLALYAQVWEYGGNGDGRGFINAVVNRATSAGITWINAAGNFGDATYRAPVEKLEEDWAYLPSPNRGVRVRCFDNSKKTCHLRAVLSWDDFKDDMNAGTDKDLDLVLTDDTLKVIRTGGLQQVLSMPEGDSQGKSLYPREIIEADLKPGVYELRVKVRSANFSKAGDELRIVTSGDYLEQLDKTDASETLLSPADNSGVITVGASDSAKSAKSAARGKPEYSTASLVTLLNGDDYKGSSNSAAIAASLATIFKGLKPEAGRDEILSFLTGRSAPPVPQNPVGDASGNGLTLDVLGFRALGPNGCFQAAILPNIPSLLRGVLMGGAVTVSSDAGFKVMTAQDPFSLGLGVNRKNADDMLVVSEKGFSARPRSSQRTLPAGSYEIVQKPAGAVYCAF